MHPFNLLFGLLALQTGLIEQGALFAGFTTWAQAKPQRRMADVLVEQGSLDGSRRAALDLLVEQHLRMHGGDPAESLAAIPTDGSIRENLTRIGDDLVDASLSRSDPTITVSMTSGEPGGTAAGAVGAAPVDGERFRAVRLHAQGGVGNIFVAVDGELHREVALKRIQERHADNPVVRARFLLEAEVTGGLEHPGIVPVYGLGSDADGRPYYAMRLVRGESLKRAIAAFHGDAGLRRDPGARSLELSKLLRRFLDVCNAIDYAHSRGVLHRDVKPGNVMVGEYGETLVVDWGLAKAVGRADPGIAPDEQTLVPSSSGGVAETLPGTTIGTPEYMSPEQAAGHIDRLGPASDVYSLGATLYCILTGSPPFRDADVGRMLRAVQEGRFPPPRRVNRSVDPALEAVCLKAMSLRPEDRYPGTRALAAEIERWLADEPVSAYREPMPGRLARWGRRHRTLVAATALSLVTAVALLAALVVAVRREQGQTDAARDLAEANYRDARGAVDDYLTSVSEEALLDEPGMQPLRRRLLQSALSYHRRFIERRANDPDAIVDLARSQAALAKVTREMGRYVEAVPGYEEAIRLYRELDARRPGDPEIRHALAECYECVADVQNVLSRRREALENVDRAIEMFESLVADRRADVRTRHNFALAVFTKAKIKHADERTREATALDERAAGLQDEVVAQSGGADNERATLAFYTFSMSNGLANTGRTAKAEEACHKAVGLYEGLVRAHPRTYKYRDGHAMAVLARANLDWRAERWAEAAHSREEARTELAELVRENPDVFALREVLAEADTGLARCYLNHLGRRDRGAAALRNAIESYQGLWRGEDTDVRSVGHYALCFQELSMIQSQDGQYVEAHANLRRACELYEQAARKSPDNPIMRGELAGSYGELADLSEKLGRVDEAAGLYRRAVETMRLIFGGGIGHAGELIASWTCGLSRMLRGQGRLEEAADLLENLRGELGGEPEPLYQIACGLSLCATDAGARADRPAPEREAVRRRYSDRAIAALREAGRAGFRDLKRLGDEPALGSLRPLRDFQLLRMDLAFPADAFVRHE